MKTTHKSNLMKLVMLAMLVAIGVVISPILRVEGMCPMAHFINIVCAVLLGPWYSLLCAVLIGIIRMTFMAIPPLALTGAVFGAFLSGMFYRLSKGKLIAAFLGEVFGTGIIGAIVSYPVMTYLVGRTGLTWFFYVPSFISGTLIGGSLAFVFLRALAKNGQLARFQTALGSVSYAVSSDVWSNAVGIAALGLIGYLASVVLLKMLLKLSGTWVTVVPYALVGAALLAAVIYLIRNRSQLRQQA
ncbi:thiW protein [Ruminococcus sp. CAG:379]|nr:MULTISPECIES: energy coupling factor transporter S component ThiW [Ruminococcus]CDD53012.1 thiW protein [Ruminococcus sp. CAG:379]